MIFHSIFSSFSYFYVTFFKRYNLRLNTTIKREYMFILNNDVILIMQ